MQYDLGNGSNGNEIIFLHRPHVLDVESNKGLSFAGRGYELDLQPCGLVHLYKSSQISGAKAMLRQVSVKDYCVEKLVFHSVSSAICYPRRSFRSAKSRNNRSRTRGQASPSSEAAWYSVKRSSRMLRCQSGTGTFEASAKTSSQAPSEAPSVTGLPNSTNFFVAIIYPPLPYGRVRISRKCLSGSSK